MFAPLEMIMHTDGWKSVLVNVSGTKMLVMEVFQTFGQILSQTSNHRLPSYPRVTRVLRLKAKLQLHILI